jgi:hypothetical protein
MIWLPAYCIPKDRKAVPPKWYHYLLTFIVPIFFQIPVIWGVQLFRQAIGHHFPFVTN